MKNQLINIKRCGLKMFPLNTKTFGGKIGRNLHSVSPGNILAKKFKIASLENFPVKNMQTKSCAKKLKVNCQFGPRFLENRYDILVQNFFSKSKFKPSFLRNVLIL